MTADDLDAAALATELAYLVDLPVEERGDAEGERYDHVRWALGDIDPADRMMAYGAAVASIDPAHLLGPYPDAATTELTIELHAYEEWRVGRVYLSEEEPQSDVARRLLLVTEPLLRTWGPRDAVAHGYVTSLLKFHHISSEDFPDFSLRDFLDQRGFDQARWDAAADVHADAYACDALPAS